MGKILLSAILLTFPFLSKAGDKAPAVKTISCGSFYDQKNNAVESKKPVSLEIRNGDLLKDASTLVLKTEQGDIDLEPDEAEYTHQKSMIIDFSDAKKNYAVSVVVFTSMREGDVLAMLQTRDGFTASCDGHM